MRGETEQRDKLDIEWERNVNMNCGYKRRRERIADAGEGNSQ